MILRTIINVLIVALSFSVPSLTKASSEQKYHNVIELLSAFTGEDATKYSPYFQYSKATKITAIEIYAVGNESTTARYTDEELPWKQVNNIVRLKTEDGFEGVSGVDTYLTTGFDEKTFNELKSLSPLLFSLKTLDPVEVGEILRKERPDISNETRANIDIALWDLASRKAGLPLHQLLGSNRSRIKGYASLPFYHTLPEYLEAVEIYTKLGFKTFKFHVWGSFKEDAKLIRAINEKYAETDFRFMIDFEYAYNMQETVKLANIADDEIFILFEGPIDDKLLDQYALLNKTIPMTLIPAGYDNYSKAFIREAIAKNAWDAARFDVTVVGGLSAALERMIITEAAGLPVEVQSWAHTLGQAVNLHLMLANDRTKFFEAPMPKTIFEFAMKNGNLFYEGKIEAPKEAGLGIEVDWEKLQQADFFRFSNYH